MLETRQYGAQLTQSDTKRSQHVAWTVLFINNRTVEEAVLWACVAANELFIMYEMMWFVSDHEQFVPINLLEVILGFIWKKFFFFPELGRFFKTILWPRCSWALPVVWILLKTFYISNHDGFYWILQKQPKSFSGQRKGACSMAWSVTWSQPTRTCFSVTEDKTEYKVTQKQTATQSSCSKVLAEHLKGANATFGSELQTVFDWKGFSWKQCFHLTLS